MREPEFIKFYLQDLMRLKDLPPATSKVLYWVLRNVGYDNKIVLDKEIKQEISLELSIAYDTVKKAIADLFSSGVFLRSSRARYIMNPDLFGKGRWEEIERIRLEIMYSEDNVSLKSFTNEKQNIHQK